jgi:Predicted nucleotidyltransferases
MAPDETAKWTRVSGGTCYQWAMHDLPHSKRKLAAILERIVRVYDPVEVWLFGSRYRGDATERSDWDLLVLVRDDAEDVAFDPYTAWLVARECDLPVDIVVETMGGFAASVTVATSLARELVNERVMLFPDISRSTRDQISEVSSRKTR